MPDTNSNLMQLRLDTQDLLDKIQAFLKGEKLEYLQTATGIVPNLIKMGEAKMNTRGIQSIMAWLTSVLSPMCVQGNFDIDLYYTYIRKFLLSLGYNLVLNSNKWDLADCDIELVYDEIKTTIVPFFSRLIGNKERESYIPTMQMRETVVQKPLDKEGMVK